MELKVFKVPYNTNHSVMIQWISLRSTLQLESSRLSSWEQDKALCSCTLSTPKYSVRSHLKQVAGRGYSPNLRGLDSEESWSLNCPLHLFLTHSHGDLTPHGHCPLWRGSKWRWRQARKAALTSSWQYRCNLRETPQSCGRRVGIRRFFAYKTDNAEALWDWG